MESVSYRFFDAMLRKVATIAMAPLPTLPYPPEGKAADGPPTLSVRVYEVIPISRFRPMGNECLWQSALSNIDLSDSADHSLEGQPIDPRRLSPRWNRQRARRGGSGAECRKRMSKRDRRAAIFSRTKMRGSVRGAVGCGPARSLSGGERNQ